MKDKVLTKAELIKLVKKQEEYIKELEECKRKPNTETMSRTPSKKTYIELECERDSLWKQVQEMNKLVYALEKSLVNLNNESMSYKNEVEWVNQEMNKLRSELKEPRDDH